MRTLQTCLKRGIQSRSIWYRHKEYLGRDWRRLRGIYDFYKRHRSADTFYQPDENNPRAIRFIMCRFY
jgi:hypothetical protein